MADDVRLVQLARMLRLPPDELDRAAAAAAIAARPDDLAAAIFQEAADSDDVISTETALDYLEGRLVFFGDLVPPTAAAEVRRCFRERLRAWG